MKESLDQAIQTTEKYLRPSYPHGHAKIDYTISEYMHIKDGNILDLYTGKLLHLNHSTTRKVYAVKKKREISAEAAFPLPPEYDSSVLYSEQLKETGRVIRQELASYRETKERIDLQNLHLEFHLARVIGNKEGQRSLRICLPTF